VIDALVTLAFEYPPRSKFFTSELEQFLLLVREQSIDPLAATGSYAGAMGGPQFISSSYRAYAVDSGGDGTIDLWSDWEDIIGSVANYFSRHGWRPGQPVFARLSGAPGDWAMSDGLRLDKSVSELRDNGIDVDPTGRADDEVMIFSLEEPDGPRYLVGYRNFYVITRYNRSNKYAMAVFELGQAIRARMEVSADAS
jgi:membrane-bound lytic murein transglycosylase B